MKILIRIKSFVFVAALKVLGLCVLVLFAIGAAWGVIKVLKGSIGAFIFENACAESAVVCAREWSNVLAVIAGAATVFFILRQIRQTDRLHREEMRRATYPMRSLFNRAVTQLAVPIDQAADVLRRWAARARSGQSTEEAIFDGANTVAGFRDHLFAREEHKSYIEQIESYDDGALAAARSRAFAALYRAVPFWLRDTDENDKVWVQKTIQMNYRVAADGKPAARRVGVEAADATDAAAVALTDYAKLIREWNDNINWRNVPEITHRP